MPETPVITKIRSLIIRSIIKIHFNLQTLKLHLFVIKSSIDLKCYKQTLQYPKTLLDQHYKAYTNRDNFDIQCYKDGIQIKNNLIRITFFR